MLEQKDLEMITTIVEKAVEDRVEIAVEKAIENRVEIAVEKAVSPIKADMRTLQLTLENETNKGIQIIAEGHLDLSRKLDEALKVENEKEMMKLRINKIESELEKVKEKLETIA